MASAIWRDADQIPLIESAWLWGHMVPLRGEATTDIIRGIDAVTAVDEQAGKRWLVGFEGFHGNTRPHASNASSSYSPTATARQPLRA
ncbi:MAG: hypothetical protein ACLP0J_01300 [Solirubrobacteraceae bacterium]